MTDAKGPMPSYRKPPVTEVAMSVEFAPLAKWDVLHFGMYWAGIRGDYPRHEIHPPLQSQVERFGDERFQKRAEMLDILVGFPEVRCWFYNDAGHLLQIQRDRFVFNWRQGSSESPYPRYDDFVRPAFEREWNRFLAFVAEHELGEIAVRQCDISYVNDIPQGPLWQTVQDLPRVLAPWSGVTSGKFLPSAESGMVAMAFVMPGPRGRLHASMQHVMRARDSKQIFQFRLTARGKPESNSNADIVEWMNLGREWIVRGFTDLTTDEAHKAWERYQ